MKKLWKSVKSWQSYHHEFGVLLFWDIVYIVIHNNMVLNFLQQLMQIFTDFRPISHSILQVMQDRAIVTIEGE